MNTQSKYFYINITNQEFNNILTGVVFVNLHREHIDNVYNACKTFKTMIDDEWKMIYHDCQHHQPHNPGEHDDPIINKYSDQVWYREGKKHRDGDLPAVIWTSGSQEWYKEGKQHRDHDRPAEIWADDTQWWYRDGLRHRDGDQPAIIEADGSQEWHKDGKVHRDGGLAAIIRADGSQTWYMDGKVHRDGDRSTYIKFN